MQLLFLNNYHYLRGGSERVFFGEMDILRSHGHTVYSFARKYLHHIPTKFEAYFPDDLKTDSVTFSFGALRTVKEIIYSKESKRSLQKLLKEYHPDIAHAHNIYGRLTTSVLDILRSENIPVVLTLHDYKLVCPSYKLMRNNRVCEDCKGHRFYKAVMNRCHKDSCLASAIYAAESYFNTWFDKYSKKVRYFISPSRFLKNKLIEFGWSKEKIEYVPNYINVNQFEPSFEPGQYLLYLGRLSPEKGIKTLILAFKKTKIAGSKLLIVGEGPQKRELMDLAADEPNIIFTGYLSGERLERTTRESLAMIVPSEWYENAPISVLEAMAYGKPIIAAKIGGIPEMLEDGVTGYFFEPGHVDDLVEKIKSLLSLPTSKLSDMSKACRRRVEKLYNEDVHYERLMEVYRKSLY